MSINTKAKIEKELVEYKEYCPLRKIMRKVRYYKPTNQDYIITKTYDYKVIKTAEELNKENNLY